MHLSNYQTKNHRLKLLQGLLDHQQEQELYQRQNQLSLAHLNLFLQKLDCFLYSQDQQHLQLLQVLYLGQQKVNQFYLQLVKVLNHYPLQYIHLQQFVLQHLELNLQLIVLHLTKLMIQILHMRSQRDLECRLDLEHSFVHLLHNQV